MKYEYKTTIGEVGWNDAATRAEGADDPREPDGEGWELVTAAASQVYLSRQSLFWFWRRPVT